MFCSKLIKTDVTAVKLCKNYIFVGIGNFLHVYSTTENTPLIKKIPIFDGQKVHGIEIDNLKENILLYGACCMQILSDFSALRKTHARKIDDWILAARWSRDNNYVAVAVMLNKVLIFNKDFTEQRQTICEKKCILYSAYIYAELDAFVIFSGTVFGQILVWKASQDGGGVVLATLEGHNGVIFSVSYDEQTGYICSSSDDRSTILWATENDKTTPKRKFYGHQSRVFRSLIYGDFVVTGGEDSCVNLWGFDGTLIRKIDTHQGGPVWALDCQNDVIVTGGGDCGVLLIPVRSNLTKQLAPLAGEVPKRLGILRSNNLVVITETGGVFYYVTNQSKWLKITHQEKLESYSLLEVSKCRKMVSLAGFSGDVYVYKEHEDSLDLAVEFKTEDGSRVFAFHWLSCQTFLTCHQGGKLILWYLSGNRVALVTEFVLPESKDVCSTAACVAEPGRYIVGDRKGNIFVFKLASLLPVQTLKRVHNYLGVTQIYNVNNKIMTLGRNGVVRTFSGEFPTVVPISSDKVPFMWLAALTNQQLLGFSGNNFLVWCYNTRRVLFEYNCGGGHRSWDFHTNKGQVSFVFVKDRAVNIVRYDQTKTYPTNLVAGYHTTTINSVKILVSADDYLVLSGGEDTTLRMSLIDNTGNHCVVQSLKSHLSSIRTVCLHGIPRGKYLMFSGGGRGQIVCWQVTVDVANLTNSICSEQYSYYEDLSEEESSEMRIMDLQVAEISGDLLLFAATSEGNVKVFGVVEDGGKIRLDFKKNLFYKLKCVTRICVVRNTDILISMSTDGTLAFWNLRKEVSVPFAAFGVHQSGINCCSYCFLGNDLVFLSGGDDGTISLILFRITKNLNAVVVTKVANFRNERAHCAQITGAFITENYFLTTSVDQKLLVFGWGVCKDQLNCKFLARYNSTVADIQGMECHERSDCFDVFLYGKGVEYVKCTKI